MTALTSRALYLGAMLASFAVFLVLGRPAAGLLPWGPIQFSAVFILAIATLFIGLRYEDQMIWKGRFNSGVGEDVGLKKTVPPAPLALGAAVGIMGALYVP